MALANLQRVLFFFCVICAVVPARVQAHNFFGDTQPLLNGGAHPFLTVPHLLLLIALWLTLFSQKKPEHFLGTFLGALLTGFLGQWLLPSLALEVAFSLCLVLWGGLVALHKPISFQILSLPLALCGFLIGVDTVSESQDIALNMVFYLGAIVGIFAFLSYSVLFKDFIKQEWHWVIIRTLGGWLFAVGLMMMAFHLQALL